MFIQHKLLKIHATYTRKQHVFTLETWLPLLANALGGSQSAEASLEQPETADINQLLDSAKYKIKKKLQK